MRFGILAVIAVALSATLLTDPVRAEPVAPPPPASEPGLPVRPDKPLMLEPAPASTGAPWKLAAFVVLAAGGFWAWKRRAKTGPVGEQAELRILRRTTVGVRSELILLELEGQKVLIGVTPSSMQTLYLLPENSEEERAPAPEKESRLVTLLDARIAPRAEPREAPSSQTVISAPDEDDSILEGQAASLRSIGARR
jgi:flagellar biogenesis protein FliO